jgi:hypothetical protein
MDEKLKKKIEKLKIPKKRKTSNNFGLMSNLFSRFEILIKKQTVKREVWIGTPFIPYFKCKQEPFKPFIDPKLKRFKEKVEAFDDGAKICSLCFLFDCCCCK